ncbi:MAG: extracellular solute-binding protein [Bacillota bacterium]
MQYGTTKRCLAAVTAMVLVLVFLAIRFDSVSAGTTLRMLIPANTTWESFHQKIIRRFEAEHPGTKVEMQAVPFAEFFRTISTSVAGGNPPDVIWADGPEVKHLAYHGIIVPLEGWIFTKEELADFLPQSLEEGSYNGKVYAVSNQQSSSAMFYNKDIMAAAGIVPPTTLDNAWTWPETLNVLKKVTQVSPQGTVSIWGYVVRTIGQVYETLCFLRSNAEPGSKTFMALSPDGKTVDGYLNSPEAIEATQFWQDLYVKHKVTPVENIPLAFESGHAAIYIRPENLIPILETEYPNLKWGVTPFPYFKTPISHTGSFMYTVTKQSKNKDLAGELVRLLTSPDTAARWFETCKQLPSRKSLYNQIDVYRTSPERRIFYETLVRWGHPRPQTPAFREYNEILGKAFADIAKGAPVKKTLDDAVRQIDRQLARYQ